MNDFLKDSTKLYSLGEQDIHPISPMDAEIINEISICLSKLNRNDLVSILDNWKKIPDEDVRDLLLSWNTGYKQQEETKYFIKFVNINGNKFLPFYIQSITTDEMWNYNKGENEYYVYLNKSDSPKTIYKDTLLLKTTSKDDVDNFIKNLEGKLSTFNILFI